MAFRKFGRLVEFDELSRNFPARALFREAPVQSIIWLCNGWLDQLDEPECVGFSWAHDIIAEPIAIPVTADYARFVYRECRMIDGFPPGTQGTSVLAGAKIMLREGWMDEYRWAFGVEDVRQSLLSIGPVVLGINWYEGMLATDWRGFIHPTGWNVGGHAILCIGYDAELDAFLLHNSWGRSWGQTGRAWISRANLDRLLREDGEACVPVVRLDPTATEPEPEPEPEPARKPCLLTRFLRWLRRLFLL
jgi:hypothetical protein